MPLHAQHQYLLIASEEKVKRGNLVYYFTSKKNLVQSLTADKIFI